MPEYIFFLGSHPDLSHYELQRVLGESCEVERLPNSPSLCVAKCSSEIPDSTFDRLGGTERVGIILKQQSEHPKPEELLSLLAPLPKKWMLGVNVPQEGFDLPSFVFAIKAQAQQSGSKLKFVLPKGQAATLNAAQVIFNKLDRAPNAELTLLPSPPGWLVVKTIWIQDIRAYEIRDTRRPARAGKIGMLPPKLAQMMVNMATGAAMHATILDPFCGMGTILQEGQLMGYTMMGSDSSPEMVSASERNLAWLAEHFDVSGDPTPEVFLHDARKPFPKEFTGVADAAVTEPYLGPARRGPLREPAGQALLRELRDLYIQAFRNFLPVLKPGAVVVFVFPAFARRAGRDFILFPEEVLDAIERTGYRRVQPLGSRERLLYARPDAWVGRELTIWERK